MSSGVGRRLDWAASLRKGCTSGLTLKTHWIMRGIATVTNGLTRGHAKILWHHGSG